MSTFGDEETNRSRDEPLLRVRGLSAGYNKDPVVQQCCVELLASEFVVIVGPNGAGKSTLLKAICGELAPYEGDVTFGGRDVTGMSGTDLARLGVGYVPQTNDVFLGMTVFDNLLIGGYQLGSRQAKRRAGEVCELFPKLKNLLRRSARVLSGGERKLLALGRCLMTEPRILLLDEPTAGLAPLAAKEVLHHHLAAIQERGTGILCVEQRAREALMVSDRVYVMVQGRVVLTEPAREFLERDDAAQWLMGRVVGREGQGRDLVGEGRS